jgi:hypothetical protein
MLQKVALLMKKVKSNEGCGLDSMAAAGDEVGGCEADMRGVGDAMAVVGVAVATGVDVIAFLMDFFFVRGSRHHFRGLECVVGCCGA